MPKKDMSEFEFSTGLPDDFDATIEQAYFKPNPQYAAKAGIDSDTPLLHLVFRGDIDNEDGSLTQAYSIGTEWEPKKNGAEIVSVRNPGKHRFNANCNGAKFVERVLSIIGSGDVKKGIAKVSDAGYPYMTEADFYKGISGHFVREQITRQGGDGFAGGTSQVLLPTEITTIPGLKGSSKKGAAAADDDEEEPAPRAKSKGKSKKTDSSSGSGDEGSEFPEQIAWLKAASKGKTKRQLKAATSAEYSEDLDETEEKFVAEVVTGDLIDRLIEAGELEVGDDGKTFV